MGLISHSILGISIRIKRPDLDSNMTSNLQEIFQSSKHSYHPKSVSYMYRNHFFLAINCGITHSSLELLVLKKRDRKMLSEVEAKG